MVYLIHLEKKFHHVKHYVGMTSTSTIEERMKRHRAGYGANLLKHVALAGIKFRVVRVWQNEGRPLEKRIKRSKNSKTLCPVCNPKSWDKNFKNTSDEKVNKNV